jgi:hypothetical protein
VTARLFLLQRTIDVSGISGTGIVAEGVVFSDGSVAMRWATEVASTVIYAQLDDVIFVHGHGGNTRVVFP